MKISSFDIFDTCLLRKCGTPENFFDVFSLRVFNGEVEEWARQEFVAERRRAEQKGCDNHSFTLQDIWNAFDMNHPQILPKNVLYQKELDLEREMLVPVLQMREMVDKCRKKGHRIIFISDMYLSSGFLTELLKKYGFFMEGDKVYVSCECGAVKWNGGLFNYVKECENVAFGKWHHYGDNKQGDFFAPRKLGIKATLINHAYTPYQLIWKEDDYSVGYKYPSILAGIGRALRYSTEWTTHTDFVLDIVAPFYCSWAYEILKEASRRGVRRLYFCARDAYLIHKVALKMQILFPAIEVNYVYMSRQALYKEDNDDAKLAYFRSIGLATESDEVAIVDTTTSGKTLQYLNSFLKAHGCKEVYGYYYLLWNKVEGVDRMKYDVKVFDSYVAENKNCTRLLSYLFIFENFFGLNDERKTVGYSFENGKPTPVFTEELQKEDCKMMDGVNWVPIHEQLVTQYADDYVKVGLGQFSDRIIEIAIATLCCFFSKPEKLYLEALVGFYVLGKEDEGMKPCVKRLYHPMELVGKKRPYYWRRGCVYYTLPNWLLRRHKV